PRETSRLSASNIELLRTPCDSNIAVSLPQGANGRFKAPISYGLLPGKRPDVSVSITALLLLQ
ncbi:MAG TPA: hypothetical protein VGD54_02690, partial [Steroidobacteraceae bacterium]